MILLQACGFLVPAFDPEQRRRMLPITAAIPVLFAAGVAFGYTVASTRSFEAGVLVASISARRRDRTG